MQKQKSNRDIDNFSEIIKNKLANYSQPVDEDSWDAIEKRLNGKPLKRVLWPWISGISAAAAIAIFVIFTFPNRENINNYERNLLSGYAAPISQDVFTEEIQQPTLSMVIPSEKNDRTSKTVRKYAEKNADTGTRVIAENAKESEDIFHAPDSKENQPPVAQENSKTIQEKQTLNLDTDFMDEDPYPVKKRNKQKSIGLSLGSGGNLLAMNKNGLSYANRYMSDVPDQIDSKSSLYASAPEAIAGDVFSTDDFSKINHYPPLSFGLTVRKELDGVFSLETGLVYTFLQSDFSNPVPKREAKLHLHYLGIPLNLNAHIYGNKNTNWSAYLSLGGMVEKGLLSHYSQKQFVNDNYTSSITSKEKINGLQWSVAVAPGIDYKLNKNYSLYLEPKLSYYFDNNQPVSARTEHPVVFGINAGVRFTW
jgi:hypothetical protein